MRLPGKAPDLPLLRPTGERIDPAYVRSLPDRLLANRHEFMYRRTASALRPGSTVLDLGCGEGYGTEILASSGLKATGVDVDPAVIVAAKAKYQESGAQFKLMTSDEIPLPDSSTDAITAFHVIEHIESPRQFMREVARVLKPRGLALISTPNRVLRLNPGERPWNRYHITEYDAESLRSVVSHGLDQVVIRGIDVDEPARSLELRRVRTLQRIGKVDVLGVRRFVPQSLITFITNTLVRQNVDVVIEPQFNISDSSLEPIDLLAVASHMRLESGPLLAMQTDLTADDDGTNQR